MLSLPSLILAKELVNKSFEVPLTEGLKTEKFIFILIWTSDQKRVCLHFLKKETKFQELKFINIIFCYVNFGKIYQIEM